MSDENETVYAGFICRQGKLWKNKDSPAPALLPGRRQQALNIWTIFGLLLLLLAGIGIVLPLLPTTPFVLLAAACFAKSSPRMHAWLLNHELFGPILRDWEANHCVTPRVKWLALIMMLVMGGTSIWFFIPTGWPRFAGLVLVGLGCLTVLSLKTCRRDRP